MTCTQAEADLWGADMLRTAAKQVCAKVHVPLTDHQLAALTSLCYNVGIGHFGMSDVLAALNRGLYPNAADRIPEYDHADGVVVTGLTTRRARGRCS